MTTIITGASGGRKHWRRKEILRGVQKLFEEEETKKEKSPKFQTILGDIQECRRRNPKRYRLGEEREKLFDKAAKQLVGQRLRGGKVIVGCIGHGSFTDIKRGIDRSIVVVGPGGQQIYNFDITGPKWVERHVRVGVKIVPVQIEKEGVDEQKSIPQIKECVVQFIEEESSA